MTQPDQLPEIVTVHDGVGNPILIIETQEASPDDARAAVRARLLAQGVSEWRIEEIMPGVRINPAWWSPTYGGFTHDCSLHLPEEAGPYCADSRPVLAIDGQVT